MPQKRLARIQATEASSSREDPRRLQVGGVKALGEPTYTQSAEAALQLTGVNRESGLAADCNLARDRSLMDKAGLTIVVQRSWVDWNDRCTRHHVLDLQGRQLRVQLPENGEVVKHCLDHCIDQLIGLITR